MIYLIGNPLNLILSDVQEYALPLGVSPSPYTFFVQNTQLHTAQQSTPAAPRAAPNQATFDRMTKAGKATLRELPKPSAEDCKHLDVDAPFNWGRPEDKLPNRLILKDACPLEERAKTETEFLTAVQDQHGFAPVLGAMTVQHGFADFAALKGLKRCGEVPEAYSGLDDGAELSMELRAQRRLLSTVEGKPLSEASALDVVYACVDCMIGASAF